MCLSNSTCAATTGTRGDVVVIFKEIKFPAKVSEAQRQALKAAFTM
jgi:hypothetical protein